MEFLFNSLYYLHFIIMDITGAYPGDESIKGFGISGIIQYSRYHKKAVICVS